ncbi:apovitellenin-1-like [Ambystoma mexicanum]|uniref:apovitellenin-1-like n=1 Tax=Ambystoma mexicanum TaxID=8296 RepID=UPI0037E959A2
MYSRALTVTLVLLLGTTLSGLDAKAIAKRHVRRDWLILPDAAAFYIYELVNNVSPKAGEILANIAQTPILLDIRNYLIQKTAAITRFAEDLQKEIESQLKKEKHKEEKEQEKQERRKQKEEQHN